MQDETFLKIIEEFKKLDGIKAIALGGSTAVKSADNSSDYDTYIYSDKEIDKDERTRIARTFSDKYEINNQFFGTGDEWFIRNSQNQMDLMYWSREWIKNQIKNVWINHYASTGYTTCFVFTVKNSKILYDTDGWFENLQKLTVTPYPDELVKNIIDNNLPLLKSKIAASYYEQIEKALKREDCVSLNHRIAAFLASYFDILFAVNKVLHPGEKRLIDFAMKNCTKVPQDMEKDICSLTLNPDKNTLDILDKLVDNLVKIC